MIDGYGKKGDVQFSGLTDTNKRAVFPSSPEFKIGDMVVVKVNDASQNTLYSEPIEKMGV